MVVFWLMIVGAAAALLVTAGPRRGTRAPASKAPALTRVDRFLTWFTGLVAALLALIAMMGRAARRH